MFSPGWVVWFPLRLLVGMKSKNRGNRQIHIKWSDELRQPVMLIVNLMPQDRLPPLQDHQDLILPISVWTWGTVDPQNSIFGESWWSTPFGCNAIALFTEPNPCKHFVYVSFSVILGFSILPKLTTISHGSLGAQLSRPEEEPENQIPGKWHNGKQFPTWFPHTLPSGKHTKNYGKSQFLIGKSTIHVPFSIAMLNYQKVNEYLKPNLELQGIKKWEHGMS